ncbi:torsin-4A isoform 2-T2 [Spinachia spinachia]
MEVYSGSFRLTCLQRGRGSVGAAPCSLPGWRCCGNQVWEVLPFLKVIFILTLVLRRVTPSFQQFHGLEEPLLIPRKAPKCLVKEKEVRGGGGGAREEGGGEDSSCVPSLCHGGPSRRHQSRGGGGGFLLEGKTLGDVPRGEKSSRGDERRRQQHLGLPDGGGRGPRDGRRRRRGRSGVAGEPRPQRVQLLRVAACRRAHQAEVPGHEEEAPGGGAAGPRAQGGPPGAAGENQPQDLHLRRADAVLLQRPSEEEEEEEEEKGAVSQQGGAASPAEAGAEPSQELPLPALRHRLPPGVQRHREPGRPRAALRPGRAGEDAEEGGVWPAGGGGRAAVPPEGLPVHLRPQQGPGGVPARAQRRGQEPPGPPPGGSLPLRGRGDAGAAVLRPAPLPPGGRRPALRPRLVYAHLGDGGARRGRGEDPALRLRRGRAHARRDPGRAAAAGGRRAVQRAPERRLRAAEQPGPPARHPARAAQLLRLGRRSSGQPGEGADSDAARLPGAAAPAVGGGGAPAPGPPGQESRDGVLPGGNDPGGVLPGPYQHRAPRGGDRILPRGGGARVLQDGLQAGGGEGQPAVRADVPRCLSHEETRLSGIVKLDDATRSPGPPGARGRRRHNRKLWDMWIL